MKLLRRKGYIMRDINKPQIVYAYAILLDNKIENWKVTSVNRNSVYDFTGIWKVERLKDYKLQKVCWVCNTVDEWNEVFNKLAPKWFKTWKYADDYKLMRAY